MSRDTIVPTLSRTLIFPGKRRPETSSPDTVRFYRAAPDHVTLQIRFPRHIATANLSPEQLRELLRDMLATAAEMGVQP
jgi:hypothetical protein